MAQQANDETHDRHHEQDRAERVDAPAAHLIVLDCPEVPGDGDRAADDPEFQEPQRQIHRIHLSDGNVLAHEGVYPQLQPAFTLLAARLDLPDLDQSLLAVLDDSENAPWMVLPDFHWRIAALLK